MTELRSTARFLAAAVCAAALLFLFIPLSGTPAEAQTYYSIYGGYRNAPPPYRDERPRETGNPFVDFFGALFGNRPRGEEDENKKANAFANHCVRTCDGKFFPVNRGGRKDLSLDKICSAMCPSRDESFQRPRNRTFDCNRRPKIQREAKCLRVPHQDRRQLHLQRA